MSYFLYILHSASHSKTYTGITDSIERRLTEHNKGKSTYTRKYVPWKLIYMEEYASRADARLREKYFKSTTGRRRIRKIMDNFYQK